MNSMKCSVIEIGKDDSSSTENLMRVRRALSIFLGLMLLTSTTVSADVTIDTGTNVARTSLGLTAMETNGTLQQIASQRAVEVASQWPKWDPSLHAQWIYGAMGCIK